MLIVVIAIGIAAIAAFVVLLKANDRAELLSDIEKLTHTRESQRAKLTELTQDRDELLAKAKKLKAERDQALERNQRLNEDSNRLRAQYAEHCDVINSLRDQLQALP